MVKSQLETARVRAPDRQTRTLQLIGFSRIQIADAIAAIVYSTICSLAILMIMELVASWRFIRDPPRDDTVFVPPTDRDDLVGAEIEMEELPA